MAPSCPSAPELVHMGRHPVCMQLALKLIASALQKQPKSQTLRVLKAVALQRSGKYEEGMQVSCNIAVFHGSWHPLAVD